MKKIKAIWRELWKQWFYKLIVAACAGLIVFLFSFVQCGRQAVAYLSLNYPGALQGEYLNGTRLNMYDMLSKETLQVALEKAGLERVLTPSKLGSMITIAPRHTSTPQNCYMATEFEVDLTLNKPLLGVDCRGLLQMVCMAFVENFYGTRANNQTLLQFSLDGISDMDYNEIGTMFQTKIDLMLDYINGRCDTDPDFASDSTGESFSSLRTKLTDFSDVALEKYNAYVLDNGLTKNLERLQSSLNYEKILLQKSYDKTIVDYDMRLEALNSYNTGQSAVVMIPTVDVSGEYYMSKTKTGIDSLALDANVAMSAANDVKKRIDWDNARLERAIAAAANGDATARKRADAMIDEMTESITALEALVVEVDNEYIRQETAKSLVYKMRAMTVRELYEFKETLAAAAITYLLLTALNWILTERAPLARRKAAKQHA